MAIIVNQAYANPIFGATSGVIGGSVTDVTTIIEHAARRCGVAAPSLSAEQQTSARENLYFILSDLANRGVSLWCVQKNLLGVVLGQARYNLPVGTVDVLNAQLRSATLIANPTFNNVDAWTVSGATQLKTIGVTSPTVQTLNLLVESSADGITWTFEYLIPPFVTLLNTPQWFDLDHVATAAYFRVRESVAPALIVTSVQFAYNGREIMMTKLNRDDYIAMPNKDQRGQPLQFWYDKQFQQPAIRVWPSPIDATVQLVLWTHRHIQDVGSFANSLEIPQRWIESVIFMLAAHICLELPPDKVPQGRLEYLDAKAHEHLIRAEDGERDGAPMRFEFGTGVYTR